MKTSVDKSIYPEWGIVTRPSFRLNNRLPTIHFQLSAVGNFQTFTFLEEMSAFLSIVKSNRA